MKLAQKNLGTRRRAAMVQSLESRRLLASTVIDVMVLYSTDARAQYANNDAAIQRAIRQSMDFANLAHQNTQDDVVLRLVHTAQLNYSNPSASQSTQLSALRGNSTVSTLRNQYGADLVSLVVDSSGGGGLGDGLTNTAGNASSAFSVVEFDAIGAGASTLAHELGHNMGAGHERDNASQPATGATTYAYGYHTAYTGSSTHGTDYGDVMSYQGATLPVFASPEYVHDGVALGRPTSGSNPADLKSTFLITGPVIANYRTSVVANAAPTATLEQFDLIGDKLTFSVRYLDDTAINVASIDQTDTYVTTPEGFSLRAAFVGLDRPGNAYATTARYSVTLPRSAPPLDALNVYLSAGQVTDVAGLAVAGGLLASGLDTDLGGGFGSFQLARDTGLLAPGTTRRITNAVGDIVDSQDLYRFTVDQAGQISLTLKGLVPGLNNSIDLFVFRDSNLNEVADTGEGLGNSFEGGTADRTFSLSATPGTYYAYVQSNASSGRGHYTLTLAASGGGAVDTTPPNAPFLDKADQAHVGTATVVDFYMVYTDNVGVDAASVANKGYLTFFTPAGNGIIKTPADVTVSGTSVIAHYNHTFPAFSSGNVTVRLSNTAGFATEVRDLAGNLITLPGGTPPTLATYRVGTLPADTAAPTASLWSAKPVLVPTGSSYDFTVAYRDNRGTDLATIDGNDILVTGPGGFSQAATLVPGSVNVSPGGGITFATYRITPPGGTWDWPDAGTYNVVTQASQVRDTANLAVAAGTIGTFQASPPYPGDATGNRAVDFDDLLLLAKNYGLYGKGYGDGDFNFDGIVNFDDLLTLAKSYNTSAPAAAAAAAPGASSIVDATTTTTTGRRTRASELV